MGNTTLNKRYDDIDAGQAWESDPIQAHFFRKGRVIARVTNADEEDGIAASLAVEVSNEPPTDYLLPKARPPSDASFVEVDSLSITEDGTIDSDVFDVTAKWVRLSLANTSGSATLTIDLQLRK